MGLWVTWSLSGGAGQASSGVEVGDLTLQQCSGFRDLDTEPVCIAFHTHMLFGTPAPVSSVPRHLSGQQLLLERHALSGEHGLVRKRRVLLLINIVNRIVCCGSELYASTLIAPGTSAQQLTIGLVAHALGGVGLGDGLDGGEFVVGEVDGWSLAPGRSQL